MKIAVIGGNGFIGKEFVRYSIEKGCDPIVIGSDHDAFSSEDENKIKEILAQCGAMVFLAAKRTTSDFWLSEYLYNVSLAAKYMELARCSLLENVIITSSMSVYSSINIPWKEDDFQAPLSLYGASKQAVDSLALWYNDKCGMKIKSLRLAQVIGMGERKGYLLNTLIDNAISGKKQMIYGNGIGRRQYIYVKDVCDAILHCVTTESENAGIFNIGMDYNLSIVELAETINEVFGNDAGIEMLKDKPEDTKEYLMDVQKAERELHWKPQYDLKEALEDIKENWLKN